MDIIQSVLIVMFTAIIVQSVYVHAQEFDAHTNYRPSL